MSLLDRLEVPAAQSRASSSATDSPRLAASRAAPAPVTPPPITSTSTTSSGRRARSSARRAGESSVRLMTPLSPDGAAGKWHGGPPGASFAQDGRGALDRPDARAAQVGLEVDHAGGRLGGPH